jgi:soluble lytic murein transglycosylase
MTIHRIFAVNDAHNDAMTCRMRIFSPFIVCILLLVALPARAVVTQDQILRALSTQEWEKAYSFSKRGGDPFIRTLATWYYLTKSPTIAPYTAYASFLAIYPDWPDQSLLKKRMEIGFLNSDPSQARMVQWFAKHPPSSSRGRLLYGIAAGKISKTDVEMLWQEGIFSAKEEDFIVSRYRNVLTRTAHENRINQLLWAGHVSAAERMLPYVSSDIQRLSRARIALRLGRPNAPTLVASVPTPLINHAGLTYERVRYRAARGDWKGVEQLLMAAPKTLPYAHSWWKYQARVIRDAIEARHYNTAKALLDKHSQIAPIERVDAEWMRGWLYYAFLNQPAAAVTPFINMYETAKLPISRARGAYWAGRALEASGKKADANSWYQKAALFPTAFFGQLAHQQLKPNTPLPLPRATPPSQAQMDQFVAKTPLAAQLRKLSQAKHASLLWPILAHSVIETRNPEYAATMAAVANAQGEYALAINLAKEAQNKGLYVSALYPMMTLPKTIAIDPALALAIARQESRFDSAARSPADARGLMQVLPTTARLVAKSHGIPFDVVNLYQPHYNVTIGSHYMRGVLSRFRGSMVLAIAAYNAGPSRPDQWLDRFGNLSADYRRNIQWTEMIPFQETRNYVQRVLENYHVYRHLLSGGKAPLQAQQVLIRK